MADPYGYPRPIVVDLTESINEFRRKVNQIGNDLGDKLRLGTDFGTSFRTDSDLVGALIELDYRINEFDSDLYLRIDGGSLFLENGTTDTLHAELTYDSASGLFQINAPRGDMTLEALSSIILDAQGGNWYFKDQTVTQMQIIGGANKEIDVPSGDLTIDVDGDIILDADGNDIQFKNGAGGDTVTHTLADNATYTIAAPADYIVDAVGDIDLDAGDLIVRFKANGTTHLTHTLGSTNFINSAQDLVRNISGALTDSATSSILRVAGTTVTDTVGTDYALTAGGNYTVDIDGNYTVDADGSIADSAGTSYSLTAGTTVTQTSGTTFDQVSGGNFTTTVTGDVLVDASGDITLDADGNDILFKNGAGGDTVTHTLADDANYTIAAPNNLYVDAVSDITLDADGGNWFFNDNAVVQFEFIAGTNKEIDVPSGDLTIDVAGDIILDADGNDIVFKNGAGADTVTHTLADNADYTIVAPDDVVIDAVGNITLDADANNIFFRDGSVARAQYALGTSNIETWNGNLTRNVSGALVDSASTSITTVSGTTTTHTVGTDYTLTAGGNSTVNITGSIDEDAGTTIDRTAGTNITDTATAGSYTLSAGSTISQTSTTTFDQISGGNFTTTVTGDVLVDASGDIALDADGGNVILRDGGVNQFNFIAGTNKEINVPSGDLTIDVAGDIIFDAGDSDIFFQRAGTTYLQFQMNDNGQGGTQVDVPQGNLSFDVAGDIFLDADGGNIVFSDNATTQFNFIGGTNKEIDVPSGDLTIDVAGDITLDADGSDIILSDNATIVGTLSLTATDLEIRSRVSDRDIIFKGNDAGTEFTALTLDMSDSGSAIFNHDIYLPDNGIARFGDASDLTIYHTGSENIIEAQNGILVIRQNNDDNDVLIQSDNGAGGVTNYFRADGSTTAAILYFGGSEKLSTTSTGINVTGNVVSDGLTVDGVSQLNDALTISRVGDGTHVSTLSQSASDYGLRINPESNSSTTGLSIHKRVGGSAIGLQNSNSAGTTAYAIDLNPFGGDVRIGDSATGVIINASGNVGIGTNTPTFTTGSGLEIQRTTATATLRLEYTGSNGYELSAEQTQVTYNSVSSLPHVFEIGSAEEMRLDASGNLLVGTTNNSPVGNNVAGVGILSNNSIHASRDAGVPLFLNRITSDGTIADFRKDGTTVGNITAENGDLVVGTGTTGLRFFDVSSAIIPRQASGGSSDDALSLGTSTNRFKDIFYIGRISSGGVSATGDNGIWVDSATGNVGIGTSAPAGDLEINGGTGVVTTGGTLIVRQRLDGDSSGIAITSSNAISHRIWKNANGALNIGPSTNPDAIISDTSGNLLVGTSTSTPGIGNTTTGVAINPTFLAISRAPGTNSVLYLNRNSANGRIIDLNRDGTLVGSIGTVSSDVYIGTGDTTIRMDNGNDAVHPAGSEGAQRSGAIDLGRSAHRWKDIWISGTANLPTVDIDSGSIVGLTELGTGASPIVASTVQNLTVTNLLTAPLVSPTTVSFNDYNVSTNQNLIKFGNDSDLVMYHDGSNSRIRDKGTGDLYIQANNLRLTNADATSTYAQGINGGAIDLRHNNNVKLVTTSTGVTVTGLLTADTKSFTIDHPTKEGMKLRYGSLEGPEHAVYVRGRLNGEDTIELPDHWTGLVDEDTITVNLTPIGKGECWVEDIQDNKVTVGGHLNCFYMVLAERKDVDKLEVEFPADGD